MQKNSIKHIYLLYALLITAFASAQKVSTKELQGNWKIHALDLSGISMNYKSQLVTLSEEMDSKVPREDRPTRIENIKKAMMVYSDDFITINPGNTYSIKLLNETATGSYTIAEHDKSYYLKLNHSDDDVPEEFEAYFSNGNLNIVIPQEGQPIIATFKKS
jgi:hypothetical protein